MLCMHCLHSLHSRPSLVASADCHSKFLPFMPWLNTCGPETCSALPEDLHNRQRQGWHACTHLVLKAAWQVAWQTFCSLRWGWLPPGACQLPVIWFFEIKFSAHLHKASSLSAMPLCDMLQVHQVQSVMWPAMYKCLHIALMQYIDANSTCWSMP